MTKRHASASESHLLVSRRLAENPMDSQNSLYSISPSNADDQIT